MSNRVLPEWAYVPWNVGMAFVLLGIAARGGAGPVAVGLGIRHWHRPVGVGLLLAGGTALIFALGLALPMIRDAFLDTRVGDASTAQMLWVVLVQIPLGTVVLEEVAFRGVLPALMGASPAIRWRWGPVLGASLLFGCWHILPSIGMNNANAAVGDALGSDQLLTTLLAVAVHAGRRGRPVRHRPARQGHQDHDPAALGNELARLLRRLAGAAVTGPAITARRIRSVA